MRVGYIYHVLHKEAPHGNSGTRILITKMYDGRFNCINLEANKHAPWTNSIKNVKEVWKFTEIGHKDQFPELLL